MKIIYAGTPDFAVGPLRALHAAGHDIVAVYSQPDRPAGRGKKLTPSPVKQAALELALRVMQPASLRDVQAQQALADLQADVIVVAAYGLILPAEVLAIPKHGCVNIHASLLPRWRGAAPIQRAIEAGDAESGISFMLMDEGLDTGDVLEMQRCPIHDEDSAADLHDRLADMGAAGITSVLERWVGGSITAQRQDDQRATYAAKLEKQAVRIDWADSSDRIARQVRAFNPWPVAWSQTQGEAKEKIRIYAATSMMDEDAQKAPGAVLSADKSGIAVACGEGVLRIHALQFPGGRQMTAEQACNGRDFRALRFD